MDNSPLGKVPPELRNNIFDLVLLPPPDTSINMLASPYGLPKPSRDSKAHLRDALALMATCKQIRQESSTTFYGANDFFIDVSEGRRENCQADLRRAIASESRMMCRWLDGLGPNAAHLRNITIYFGRWCRVRFDEDCGTANPGLTPWAVDTFTEAFKETKAKIMCRFDVLWGHNKDTPTVPVVLSAPYSAQQQQSAFRAIDALRQHKGSGRYYHWVNGMLVERSNDCEAMVGRLFESLRGLRSAV
ncbi:hypothetical protein LTR85_008785 [Meristemomyces frigidus]|nr:hypothetical protein LTR85_008785 [Meristemomyces frigidus]